MSILSRDELMKIVLDRVKDDTTDEALKYREDVTDTIQSFVEDTDGTDWHQKYIDNDAQWRKKYADRFNKPVGETNREEAPAPTIEIQETAPETLEFENLFKH